MSEKLKGIFEEYFEGIYNEGMKRVIDAWIDDGGTIEVISERTGIPIEEIHAILNTPSVGK